MAQFPNFLGHGENQEHPLNNLAEKLVESYYNLPDAKNSARQMEAEAAIKGAQAQYAPEMEQAKIQHLLTSAQNARQGGNLTGTARDYQSLQLLGELYGTDSDVYKNAEQEMNLGRQSKQANLEGKNIINRYRVVQNLTSGQKEALFAKYRGAGGTDVEIMNAVAEGLTPQQYAIIKGFSPEEAIKFGNEDPIFVPTTASLSTGQDLESREAENAILQPFVAKGLGNYPQNIAGISPALYSDSVAAANGDQAAKERLSDFMAAKALETGLISGIQSMEGSSNAFRAAQLAIEKMSVGTQVPDFLKTPELFMMAQKKIQDNIQAGNEARVSALKGNKSHKKPETEKKAVIPIEDQKKKIQQEAINESYQEYADKNGLAPFEFDGVYRFIPREKVPEFERKKQELLRRGGGS